MATDFIIQALNNTAVDPGLSRLKEDFERGIVGFGNTTTKKLINENESMQDYFNRVVREPLIKNLEEKGVEKNNAENLVTKLVGDSKSGLETYQLLGQGFCKLMPETGGLFTGNETSRWQARIILRAKDNGAISARVIGVSQCTGSTEYTDELAILAEKKITLANKENKAGVDSIIYDIIQNAFEKYNTISDLKGFVDEKYNEIGLSTLNPQYVSYDIDMQEENDALTCTLSNVEFLVNNPPSNLPSIYDNILKMNEMRSWSKPIEMESDEGSDEGYTTEEDRSTSSEEPTYDISFLSQKTWDCLTKEPMRFNLEKVVNTYLKELDKVPNDESKKKFEEAMRFYNKHADSKYKEKIKDCFKNMYYQNIGTANEKRMQQLLVWDNATMEHVSTFLRGAPFIQTKDNQEYKPDLNGHTVLANIMIAGGADKENPLFKMHTMLANNKFIKESVASHELQNMYAAYCRGNDNIFIDMVNKKMKDEETILKNAKDEKQSFDDITEDIISGGKYQDRVIKAAQSYKALKELQKVINTISRNNLYPWFTTLKTITDEQDFYSVTHCYPSKNGYGFNISAPTKDFSSSILNGKVSEKACNINYINTSNSETAQLTVRDGKISLNEPAINLSDSTILDISLKAIMLNKTLDEELSKKFSTIGIKNHSDLRTLSKEDSEDNQEKKVDTFLKYLDNEINSMYSERYVRALLHVWALQSEDVEETAKDKLLEKFSEIQSRYNGVYLENIIEELSDCYAKNKTVSAVTRKNFSVLYKKMGLYKSGNYLHKVEKKAFSEYILDFPFINLVFMMLAIVGGLLNRLIGYKSIDTYKLLLKDSNTNTLSRATRIFYRCSGIEVNKNNVVPEDVVNKLKGSDLTNVLLRCKYDNMSMEKIIEGVEYASNEQLEDLTLNISKEKLENISNEALVTLINKVKIKDIDEEIIFRAYPLLSNHEMELCKDRYSNFNKLMEAVDNNKLAYQKVGTLSDPPNSYTEKLAKLRKKRVKGQSFVDVIKANTQELQSENTNSTPKNTR